jgi:hypothetical protein
MHIRFFPDDPIAGDDLGDELATAMTADGSSFDEGQESFPVDAPAAEPEAVQDDIAAEPLAEPVAQPAVQPVQEQAPAVDPLIARARQLGIDLPFENGDQALIGFAQMRQQMAAHQQQQEEQRAYQARVQEVQRMQQEQAALEQQYAARFEQYKAPEWKKEWAEFLTRDESGALVAKPGAPPDVLQKYNAYVGWRTQTAEKVLHDPEGFMGPILEKKFKEFFQQETRQREHVQHSQYLAAPTGPYAQYLFQSDAQGQIVYDQLTGRAVPSPMYGAILQEVNVLAKAGVQDPNLVMQLAINTIENRWWRSQQGQQQQPQQQRQPALPRPKPSLATQAAAAYRGNASPAAEPETLGKSLADQLAEAMRNSNVDFT